MPLALGFDCRANRLEQTFKIAARRQIGAQHFVHQLGEVDGADVGNVVAHAGNDELPAGGNHIVHRVGVIVAQARQAFDDHIVVGILREAEANFGQLGAHIVKLDGGILIDAQIDFRVDEFEVARSGQAELGEQIKALGSVRKASAKHHALPVVALLNANVEVAILIEGKEEIFHQFQCAFLGVNAGIQIFFEVGEHILVEATDGVMVVALQPEREMQNAEELKCLAEIARAVARNAVKNGNNVLAPHALCLGLIPVAKPDDGVNDALLRRRGVLAAGKKPLGNGFFVVGGEVGNVAQLMDIVVLANIRPLRLGQNVRQLANGAAQNDFFQGMNGRGFLLASRLKAAHHALLRGESFGCIFSGKIFFPVAPQSAMHAVDDIILIQFVVHGVLPFSGYIIVNVALYYHHSTFFRICQ